MAACSSCTNKAKDQSGGHNEALELDEYMDFPSAIILNQDLGIERASSAMFLLVTIK
jgi:hypothetical protein